jgi:hypothetical protein
MNYFPNQKLKILNLRNHHYLTNADIQYYFLATQL